MGVNKVKLIHIYIFKAFKCLPVCVSFVGEYFKSFQANWVIKIPSILTAVSLKNPQQFKIFSWFQFVPKIEFRSVIYCYIAFDSYICKKKSKTYMMMKFNFCFLEFMWNIAMYHKRKNKGKKREDLRVVIQFNLCRVCNHVDNK